MTAVLDPGLTSRLARLRLSVDRPVQGRYAGAHGSRRYGTSLEFADYREYVPGDDPRTVDRHAHARLGRLLVRRYQAEDETGLRVVLDASASMGFGRKREIAVSLAAALAVVAQAGGDRVRVLIAGGDLDVGPWYRGKQGLWALQRRLAALEPAGRPDLVTAARRARAGAAGPVLLVSDLLDPDWPAAIQALGSGRGNATCVHLLSRGDLEPELAGDVRVVDAETGTEVDLTVDRQALAAYRRRRDVWLAQVRQACRAAGVRYLPATDDEPVQDLVTVGLVRLGVVR